MLQGAIPPAPDLPFFCKASSALCEEKEQQHTTREEGGVAPRNGGSAAPRKGGSVAPRRKEVWHLKRGEEWHLEREEVWKLEREEVWHLGREEVWHLGRDVWRLGEEEVWQQRRASVIPDTEKGRGVARGAQGEKRRGTRYQKREMFGT